MSVVKQIVKNSLELRGADQKIIDSVDTLIRRAFLRLSKSQIMPPRTWEFEAIDEKNVKDRIEYIKLPEDFRELESFYVYEDAPYMWVSNIEKILEEDSTQKRFIILNENIGKDDKGQRWLVASPFPKDNKTIRIRYFSNGNCTSWDWIDEQYWESIISEVESILGLTSPEQADEHRAKAIKSHKEPNGGLMTLKGKYFGGVRHKRTRHQIDRNR